MKLLKIFIFILSIHSLSVLSKVKVSDLSFKEKVYKGELKIKFQGKLKREPLLVLKKNILQITLPHSEAWPKIEKKTSMGGKNYNATLLAYQYNKDDVRVRILFPENHNLKVNQVDIKKKNSELSVSFPAFNYSKKTSRVKKNAPLKYDESYLDSLLKDGPESKLQKKEARKVTADEINLALSSNLKKNNNNTFNNYLLKFITFIFLIIGVLYGAFYFFKKGILKKGKIGFLKNSEGVNILSTTYLGPKKNLIVVKVYGQVLLLGSSESGVTLITELNNTAAIVKEGEASLSGTNFDLNLDSADIKGKEFKIKEDILNSESKVAQDPKKDDKSRFAQQIKNKLKDLKPLQ